MEEIEKLEAEVVDMNNPVVSAVWEYLKTRTDLYEKFSNAEKSIKQMYEFIYEKARKQKKDNVAAIMDNVVFLWAVSYFSKSNEELGIKDKKVMPPSCTEVIEKIDKKKDKNSEEKKKDDGQISMFQGV